MTDIAEAKRREELFLAAMSDGQDHFEWLLANDGWITLGWSSFADWWESRVQPIMRALSMRPTREIAASVVEQVRAEEAGLPPTQRRTQRELAEMVGVGEATVGRLAGTRSTTASTDARVDLDPSPSPLVKAMTAAVQEVAEAIDRHLPPDPDEPHREWRRAFLSALGVGRRAMQFDVEAVAERADDECLDELRRLATDITSYTTRVVARRPVVDNVRHLKAI